MNMKIQWWQTFPVVSHSNRENWIFIEAPSKLELGEVTEGGETQNFPSKLKSLLY